MNTAVRVQPRHRKASRPLTPLTPVVEAISVDKVRGAAAASITGLALTAVVSPVAGAAPADSSHHVPVSLVTSSRQLLSVSVPDIAWAPSVTVDVVAESPSAPSTTDVAEPPAAEAVTEADDAQRPANRSHERTAETVVPPAPRGNDAVSIAMSLLGIPYMWGGVTPSGFDCSGFTQYVYGLVGIGLPRTSDAQGQAGVRVPASEARPGDLVWHAYGHVGIYAGDGMVIEATSPGDTTKVQPLWGNYEFVRVGR